MKQQEIQIRKRVACEERAFNVVLRLIENPITEDYLVDACQLIMPSHYADVVEERSIAKLCGYPLCGNTLGKVPKQRYQISTKNNMVYDITERKKFCSNLCLKSSQYLEKQIPDTPVWTRENEPRVNIEFLRIQNKSCSRGDAVFLPLPQTEVKKAVKILDKMEKSSRHEKLCPVGESENDSGLLSDVVERMARVKVSYQQEVDGINVDFSQERELTQVKMEEETAEDQSSDSREKELKENTLADSSVNEEVRAVDQSSDTREKQLKENTTADYSVKTSTAEKVLKSSSHKGQRLPDTAASEKVGESSLYQGQRSGESTQDYLLRLLDRKKHLLGQLADIQHSEAQTKQVSSPKKELDSDEEDEDSQPDQSDGSTACQGGESSKSKPLSEDDVQGVNTLSPVSRKSNKHKISPEKHLKLQPLNAVAKVMEQWLSRDSFKLLGVSTTKPHQPSVTDSDFQRKYTDLCRRVAEDERDFENLLGEEKMNDSFQSTCRPMPDYKKLEAETASNELRVREFYRGSAGRGQGQRGDESEGTRTVQLPVVDSHDQMTIRRKIVMERLNIVIPDILAPLRLTTQDVFQPIRELLFTFRFSSKNILFKPGEWTLVGILVLKLLSLNSKKIETAFKEDSAARYFHIILSGLGHSVQDLDTIVKTITSFVSDK